MDKSSKIAWLIVIICFIVLFISLYFSNENREELLKQRAVANVIMIEKIGNYKYAIAINGYNIQTWTIGNIRVKIDPHTVVTKAKFTPSGSGHYHGTPVTLTFTSAEEARKVLGSGYANVTGNNNIVMQNKNNNKSGCFISAIF